MITHIFLDIDDVLNKCTLNTLRHLGIETTLEEYPRHLGYDIVSVANYLLGEEKYDVKSFWNAVPREVWSNYEKSDEFDFIFENCEKLVGREKVLLLTAPTKCPECHGGKYVWITKFCPPWMHRQYSICTRKFFNAKPGALLIDDSDHNINLFRNPPEWVGPGGSGILVPRPWNTLHDKNTMDHLANVFDHYLSAQGCHA